MRPRNRGDRPELNADRGVDAGKAPGVAQFGRPGAFLRHECVRMYAVASILCACIFACFTGIAVRKRDRQIHEVMTVKLDQECVFLQAAETERDGQKQYEARVAAVTDELDNRGFLRAPEVMRVQVPAPISSTIVRGALVKFDGLGVTEWRAKDGRSGLIWTADGVVTNGSKPGGPPAGASGAK